MAAASAKYAANPTLTAKIHTEAVSRLPIALPPNPESLDFNERLDRAIVKSSNLLAEAQAQLAAPVCEFLLAELTPSEVAEQKNAEKWMKGYRLADETTDRKLESNQKLFEEVIGTIDQTQADGFPVPDDCGLPSPPPTPLMDCFQMPGAWIADCETPSHEYSGVPVISRVPDKRTTATFAMTRGQEVKATDLNSLYDGLAVDGCTCFNSLLPRQTRRPQPLPFETKGNLGDRTRLPANSKRVARSRKKVRAEKVVFAFGVSFAW